MPLIALALLGGIACSHRHLMDDQVNSSLNVYLNSLMEGKVASGIPTGTYSPDRFTSLEPGDILLGGWTDCAYGKFSHAGIYAGDGVIMEALVDTGVVDMNVDHFMEYAQIAVVRVKTSPEAKRRAVDYVLSHKGEMFFPLAFKTNSRYWNCTSILWRAYAEQGVDLDYLDDLWVTPENIKYSPQVEVVFEKGGSL